MVRSVVGSRISQLQGRILGVLFLSVALVLAGCSKKTAEEKGAEMAKEKIDLVKGVGSALEEHGSKAAESVAHGTGEVMKGLESGFDKSFGRTVKSDASLSGAGLAVSKVQDAKPTSQGNVHGIDVYVVASQAASGKLRLVAFDKKDQEVGRADVGVKYAAGDARYETLALDERIDLNEIKSVSFSFTAEAGGATGSPAK